MSVIEIRNLTKDYGNQRGVFDVSLAVEKREVFGFLGPNGAGKTTAIRQVLGVVHPDSGEVRINGKQVRRHYDQTNAEIGYLPGEISFPDGMRGTEFIAWIAELRGLRDLDRAHALMERLQLRHADGEMKRMSKGMKQKIGIVCAFMHDPSVLILDEPTGGLDPLIQETFVELIREEKQRGKTSLMSSHMFTEIEKTCDRTAIIRNGRIAAVVSMADIRKSTHKGYKIKFHSAEDTRRFAGEQFELAELNPEKTRVRVRIDDQDINRLIRTLAGYDVRYLSEEKQTLEDCFMQYYHQTEAIHS